MTKKILDRLRILRECLLQHPVSSQGELARLLAEQGVRFSQPTLSRALKQLGAFKRSKSSPYEISLRSASPPAVHSVKNWHPQAHPVVVESRHGSPLPLATLAKEACGAHFLGTSPLSEHTFIYWFSQRGDAAQFCSFLRKSS